MDPTIIAALCSAGAAIIGAFLGYLVKKRDISETNKVLVYKVDELIDDVKALGKKFDEYQKTLADLSLKVSQLEAEQRAIEQRLDTLEKVM